MPLCPCASGVRPRQLRLAFGFPAYPERDEDERGEQIEPPGDFHATDADAFGQHDVERDEEHIRHRQLAHDLDGLEQARRGEVEMDKRQPNGFEVGGYEGEEGHDEGEEDVRPPERLQPGENGDLIERKERQQPRAHQGGAPGDRVEQQEREVEGAEHGGDLGVRGALCQGEGPEPVSERATAPYYACRANQVKALKLLAAQCRKLAASRRGRR